MTLRQSLSTKKRSKLLRKKAGSTAFRNGPFLAKLISVHRSGAVMLERRPLVKYVSNDLPCHRSLLTESKAYFLKKYNLKNMKCSAQSAEKRKIC